MARVRQYAVAASGRWTDEEEGRRRLPSGEVHAWVGPDTGCAASARAAPRSPDAAAPMPARAGTAPTPGRERRSTARTDG
ncbi:hypothetical protein GCM10010383_70320 [Streptomyces lomondensis]|uniref:Uncharacterized protein n=1 Tax=Streptomyces lomondensis TaxID=68229 RepID=A0ABQ2XQS9_9ACTN|nr:hypothetical protein GCM10010383_70320 [Streptomyces lomondensis]